MVENKAELRRTWKRNHAPLIGLEYLFHFGTKLNLGQQSLGAYSSGCIFIFAKVGKK